MTSYGQVTIGLSGGMGQRDKNEDGVFVSGLVDPVVAIFDGHTSDDSVVRCIDALKTLDFNYQEMEISQAFKAFEETIQGLLQDLKTQDLLGETAAMFVYQREGYLSWISVGDNSLYLFHPEWMALGQYRLNQRIFYQWVGKANSIQLDVPCYERGTIELRAGMNRILMITDGILEIQGRPFEDHEHLYQTLIHGGPEALLEEVLRRHGRDNASLVTWTVDNPRQPLRPTRRKT